MLTIIVYVIMIVAVGVAIGILVRAFQRVQSKAVQQGVVFKDGIQSHEAKIMATLVEEELREQSALEDARKAMEIAQKLIIKLTKTLSA